jgi:transglutaminase-like putative cysteine protease
MSRTDTLAPETPQRLSSRPSAPSARDARKKRRADVYSRRQNGSLLWPVSLATLLVFLVTISTLSPLLDGASWWLGIAMLGVVILCSAATVRGLGAKTWVGSLVGAAVWLALLVLFFVPHTAIGLVIPTWNTIDAFGDLAANGFRSISRQGTPAEADLGIRFILAVGAGAFALLADILGSVLRMPALVGIPVVAIALVPGFVIGEVNLIALALCAAAYLVLLWADTRARQSARKQPHGMLGIGAFAVIGSLLLAATAPGYNGESLFQATGGSSFGRGVSPLVDLGKDLRRPGGATQFSYSTTTDESLYFRLLTLDQFDGTTWSASRANERVLNEPDLIVDVPGLSADVVTEPTSTTIDVGAMVAPWVPVPFPSVRVFGLSGRWLWDVDGLTLSSRLSSASGQSYIAESVLIKPTREQLIASPGDYPAEVSRFLELPPEIPQIITDTAQEVAGGAANGFDKAFALQQFLRSTDFTYSIEAPVEDGYDGDGFDVIARFLEEKSGYCVHYASAMAIMARALDIPARVSLGYLPGDRLGGAGERRNYTVGTDDLHSWPELYFSGIGWVPFEPTPGRGFVPDYAASISTGQSTAGPNDLDSGNRDPQQQAPVDPATQAPTGSQAVESEPPAGMFVAIGFVLLVIIAVPTVSRSLRRRRRFRDLRSGRAGPSEAWLELMESSVDFGIGVSEAETPRGFAARITESTALSTPDAEALTRLLDTVERLRFSNNASPAEGEALVADVTRLRDAMATSATLPARVRATLAPASVLRGTYSRRTAGTSMPL